MRVSRPWASLASGSFDAWSGSLFIWKMTALVKILKQVEMTAAELNVTPLCSRCSLSCVICQVKQLPHLHIFTLSIFGCYALQRVFWNSLETKLTSTKVMFLLRDYLPDIIQACPLLTSSQLTFTLTYFHGRADYFFPLTNHQRLTYQINESKQMLSRHWCADMTRSGYGGVLGVVQWSKSRLLSWAILRIKWTTYYILVEIQIKGYIVDLFSSCFAPVIQLYEQLVSRNLTHLFFGPPTAGGPPNADKH